MTAQYRNRPAVQERINLLIGWIESQMAYREQPGLAIGLVHDQELVWGQGFGYANIEQQLPATPQTLFRIASITKLFTSTALLQLRDAGLLQLDDPIHKHLPWFAMKPAEAGAIPITLRHLITHTSGLPREAPFPYWTDSVFPDIVAFREQLVDRQSALPPETQWKYSNLALALAGEVISAVSGIPYESYIETHILQPLGMSETLVHTPDAVHPGLAVGYSRRLPRQVRQRSPHTDAQALTSAFNMASNVEDLARFIMLQFRTDAEGTAEDRSQILAPRTLREMHRVHWLEPDWQSGWGLGFAVTRQGNKTLIGHGGAVQGHRTQLIFLPADKVGVIVLTNADDGDPIRYQEKVLQWVLPALLKPAGSEPVNAGTENPLAAYLGNFRNAWRDIHALVLEGQLTLVDPTLPDPLAFRATLEPVSEHVFRMVKANGGWPVGELVIYELDEQGLVQRMKMGDNFLLPIERW
jgi:CubicO group peptidase (beta-lactamase class C family)